MQKIINDLKITTGSFLEFMVLKMLSGKMSYSIQEIFDILKHAGFNTPKGSIYPLMTKFRRNNYVKSSYEEGESGFGIRTYYLTEKGRQKLATLKGDWNRLNQLIASLGTE